MRKGTKIALWIVLTLVVVLAAAVLTADIWASRVANKAIQKAINNDTTTTTIMSIGDVHVLLLSGCVGLEDIYLTTDTAVAVLNEGKLQAVNPQNKKPGMAVYVPYLSVNFVDYIRFARRKELNIHDIAIDDPQLMVLLDEKYPEKCLPEIKKTDTTTLDVNEFLKKVALSSFYLNRASCELRSVRTKMHAKVDSISLNVNNLSFNLLDTTFAYNDSVYKLSMQHAYFRLADGSAEVDTRGLETEDAGALKLGKTRFRNLIDSKKMAEREKDYITWVDLTVNRVQTSAFNPIRKALAQDWTLDSVYADVQKLHVIRDQHISPNRKFPVPQEILMKIPAKFDIKNVAADVNAVNINFTLDAVNYGKMNLNGLKAKLKHVSNKTNIAWTSSVRGTLGGESRLDATFVMHMNKNANFETSITGTNVELGALNDFLRPIVGLTCESHVDTLQTHYSGDAKMAQGDFLMMYHGLDVQFHKDQDIAVKEIKNFGGLIQGFANNLVPKSNPTVVDAYPRKYAVEWKHDEYKPYPLFVVGPVIIGVVETMLPGLYVHKQIKYNKK